MKKNPKTHGQQSGCFNKNKVIPRAFYLMFWKTGWRTDVLNANRYRKAVNIHFKTLFTVTTICFNYKAL